MKIWLGWGVITLFWLLLARVVRRYDSLADREVKFEERETPPTAWGAPSDRRKN
jgi:Na+-transporting methylmalonyl-CoA/oxaloacetate decarboxylase gamma subunit